MDFPPVTFVHNVCFVSLLARMHPQRNARCDKTQDNGTLSGLDPRFIISSGAMILQYQHRSDPMKFTPSNLQSVPHGVPSAACTSYFKLLAFIYNSSSYKAFVQALPEKSPKIPLGPAWEETTHKFSNVRCLQLRE